MNGSLTVVKLGGSLLEDASLRGSALDAIAASAATGERLVVVHGGGKKIDATLASMGIPKRSFAGLRITDAPTLEVVTGVLAGVVNKRIVLELQTRGQRAAGFSGVDGRTIEADPHPPIDGVDLGFVGRVGFVAPALIQTLLGGGFLPVIATVASGPESLLNVNADAAAAALAVFLGAQRLLFLTDVEGLMDGEGQIIEKVHRAQANLLLESGVVHGGMKPKMLACLEALTGGVPEIVIAGPSRHAAALTEGTGGTHLVAA